VTGPTTIPHSEIVRDGVVDRLDAEFFRGEIIALEKDLADRGGQPVRAVASLASDHVADPKKWDSGEPSFPYIEISGVDTYDGFVLSEEVPLQDAPSRARLDLKAGQVALSSVRPNRNHVFLITPDLDRAVGSTGLIVLNVEGEAVPPEALFVLLKARVVVDQLDRRARASMYPTLHPSDVLDVTLPPARAGVIEEIVALVRKAESVRAEFVQLARTMQETVDSSFESMMPHALVDDLRRSSPSLRLRSSLGLGKRGGVRLDAEYYRDAYEAAHERLRKAGDVAQLGQIVSLLATGKSPSEARFYEDDTEGPAMIKVGALSGLGINWPRLQFIGSSWSSAVPPVREGDVLFNSTAHEPGYIAHRVDVVGKIPDEFKNRLSCVADIMRLRVKDPKAVPPHYVAAFLRNPLGREQIRRCTCGVRGHVYESDLRRSVVVPLPRPDLAERVSEAASALETARWRYRSLVREAISIADSL